MPGLDRFLTAIDLDDLLRARHDIASLTPEESARIVSVVRDWNDRQAVANLMLHPDLMPTDVCLDAVDRALHSNEVPYFTLAATVGLQGMALDKVPRRETHSVGSGVAGFDSSDVVSPCG